MTKSKRSLLITILGLSLLFFLSQLIQESMVFNRTNIENGQWWRVLTGNLTHSNYPHLLLNTTGLWILSFLFIDSLNTKTFIIWTALLSSSVGLGLYYFTPELQKYYGFSGVLYGLYFISGISATLKKDYFTGISVVVLVVGKVIWDFFKGASTSSEQLIGIPVATDAHFYGLLGALVISGATFLYHLKKTT
jgi:rhomboid family GlyGly-CTERM serine protease